MIMMLNFESQAIRHANIDIDRHDHAKPHLCCSTVITSFIVLQHVPLQSLGFQPYNATTHAEPRHAEVEH